MIIIWRNNKAGYVGGQKIPIKGVFQYTYSKTSEAAAVGLDASKQNGPFLKNIGRLI
jgi:hypothetical protein